MSEKRLIDKPLSYSQMYEFLTCRERWYERYVLGIRPKLRSTPMEIGDAVHRALAAFLSGKDPAIGIESWYADLLRALPIADPELEAKALEMRDNALLIVRRAIAGLTDLGFWTLNDAQGVPYTERSFITPLPDIWPGGLVTNIDWIAWDNLNRRAWIVDFKTRGYLSSEQDEEASFQNPIYQAAAYIAGIETVGTITFQVKSAPPKQPKVNKDGTMSRAAVACDWQTYREALLAAGLDPAEYGDMQAKLAENELVRVTPVIRSPETVKRIWDDILEPTARLMANTYDNLMRYPTDRVRQLIPRNMSPRNCGWCGVREICFGQLRGYDVPAILVNSDRYDYRAEALERLAQ